MRISSIFVVLACVVLGVTARPQEDGEGRAVPQRGLLKRGPLAKGKPTTTTSTQAPAEEAEYDEEAEYPAEDHEPSSEAPPSSTEGKKLVGSGVRPFRSNTDLLETLKRRRAQAAETKLHGHSSIATSAPSQDASSEAPAKSSSFSKKQFNRPPAKAESVKEEVQASPSKPNRSRFGKPTASRNYQEHEPEDQNDAAPPVRQARTFNRRGGN